MGIRWKTDPPAASRLSRLFKVIGTDTGRSGTYVVLLVVHTFKHGPVFYRFQDVASYWPNIAIFFLNPRLFNAPADGVPLELCKTQIPCVRAMSAQEISPITYLLYRQVAEPGFEPRSIRCPSK